MSDDKDFKDSAHARDELGLRKYLFAERETNSSPKDGIGWIPCSIREGGKRCREDVVARSCA